MNTRHKFLQTKEIKEKSNVRHPQMLTKCTTEKKMKKKMLAIYIFFYSLIFVTLLEQERF